MWYAASSLIVTKATILIQNNLFHTFMQLFLLKDNNTLLWIILKYLICNTYFWKWSTAQKTLDFYLSVYTEPKS